MPTDQLVSARDVLRAMQEVRRVGIDRLLRDWERREPDLLEHLLEGVGELHRRVGAIAPHPSVQRRLVRSVETLVLVLLTAQRRAMLRHWRDEPVPRDTPAAIHPGGGAPGPPDHDSPGSGGSLESDDSREANDPREGGDRNEAEET